MRPRAGFFAAICWLAPLAGLGPLPNTAPPKPSAASTPDRLPGGGREWVRPAGLRPFARVPDGPTSGVERPTTALYYADVHYSLNYFIARVIGFSPEQAYRLARACVSVDYAPFVEPTQLENGIADLKVNGFLAARYLVVDPAIDHLGISFTGSDADWFASLNTLALSLENLLGHDEFRETFVAQWRFHAFRDIYRWPLAKLDGPPYSSGEEATQARAADAAVVKQRELLYREAIEIRNPGIFLHFLQDEVPHRGYTIGGGHWVMLPGQWQRSEQWAQGAEGQPSPEWRQHWHQYATYDKRGSMPSGSTTDWLSYRSLEANRHLVLETARHLIAFMQAASKGRQKPRVDTPEKVLAIVDRVLPALRDANAVPTRLKNMRDVIATKILQAQHLKAEQGLPEIEAQFGKQADGPSVPAAHAVLNPVMAGMGMEAIPPNVPRHFEIALKSDTDGALIKEVDESYLYGGAQISIDNPAVATGAEDRPARVDVVAYSVPSQTGEQPYELDKGFFPSPVREQLNGKEALIDLLGLPMGEVDFEARYTGRDGAPGKTMRTRVKLEKANTPVVLRPPGEAGDVWVLKGRAIVRGLGARGSMKEGEFLPPFSASETGLSFKRTVDGKTYTNSVTWSQPEQTLRDGQMVRIRLTITNNGPPYVQNLRTHVYARCCSSQGRASWGIAHDQKERTIEFAFEPDAYTQASGEAILRADATADDYFHHGAEVLWIYERGGRQTAAAAPPGAGPGAVPAPTAGAPSSPQPAQPTAPAGAPPTPPAPTAGAPAQQPSGYDVPAPGPARDPTFELGIDRPGSDYRNFLLPAADPALCSAQCSREGQCRAWTYVKPGVQGPEPRCWLKDRVPNPVPGADYAISGVRAGAVAPGTCRGFAGVWRIREFGHTVLVQEGDRISGTYDNGTLTGTVKGNVLEAEWDNSKGNKLRGTTRLELLPDGTIKGKAETTGWVGTINGACDTSSVAP